MMLGGHPDKVGSSGRGSRHKVGIAPHFKRELKREMVASLASTRDNH